MTGPLVQSVQSDQYNGSMAYSLEVAALIRLAALVKARVTDIATPGVHAATSYHYALGTGGEGLAVDLGETSGPSALTPGLKRIATDVARLIGPMCAELIYAEGPCLRNGRPFQYSATTLAQHRNHVHVAVNKGFRYAEPSKEVRPMFDPALQIVAYLDSPAGGSWLLAKDGAIYAIGGAPYQGGANGKDYFAGRTAARLELVGDKYQIIATSGEKYGPGF